MGFDFTSLQVFAGADKSVRDAIINCIENISEQKVSEEKLAGRCIVVGPPDRWIFVGDTAGSTEFYDKDLLNTLITSLSHIAPTVRIIMSDSCTINMTLHHNGQQVDKVGDGKLPFYKFENAKEAREYKIKPKKWIELLDSNINARELKRAWPKNKNSYKSSYMTLQQMATALGLNSNLSQTGYTYFDEVDEIKYTLTLEESQSHESFKEFYFAGKKIGDLITTSF